MQYFYRKKKDVNFFKWPIAGNPTESVNWSTIIIRQSGIQSLNTRREWLPASREKKQGYVGYNMGTGCHKQANCFEPTMVL